MRFHMLSYFLVKCSDAGNPSCVGLEPCERLNVCVSLCGLREEHPLTVAMARVSSRSRRSDVTIYQSRQSVA